MRNLEIEIFNFNKDILNFIKSLDKQEERNWCKKQIKTIINKIDKNDYSISQFKIFYENCRNKKVSLKDRFIFKFGKLNGVLLYNEYLSKTKQNKETFIKRYGYSEGIKKFNIFKNKSDNKSLNFFIKKYGKDLGIQKYNENCKKMSENTSTSLKYFLNKGYTKQQALEKVKERNGVCSLKYQIKKYGKELGIKKYNEICKIRKNKTLYNFILKNMD